MLVLSRKVDEALIIGENVEIRVLSIDGGSVRIGIDAPRFIKILRKELYEEVTNDNFVASKVKATDTEDLEELL